VGFEADIDLFVSPIDPTCELAPILKIDFAVQLERRSASEQTPKIRSERLAIATPCKNRDDKAHQ